MASSLPLRHMVTGALLLLIVMATGSLAQTVGGGNIILVGYRLPTGRALTRGSCSFIMQTDCNLVLYQQDGNGVTRPRWNSGTNGRGSDCYLLLQSDGNLVVYTAAGNPQWASNTRANPSKGPFYFNLHEDCTADLLYATDPPQESFWKIP